MKKHIKIDLSTDGIESAVKELNDLKKAQSERLDAEAKAIADLLCKKAQQNFANAWYDQLTQGVRREANVRCRVEKTVNGYRVVAEGEQVTFIEFGAGVYFNAPAGSSPHPRGEELGFIIGEFGQGYGKKNTWGYYEGNGAERRIVITHGTAAQMPLYMAFLEVLEVAKA